MVCLYPASSTSCNNPDSLMEGLMPEHIRYVKSPEGYTVSFYYEDRVDVKVYRVRTDEEVRGLIAKALSLPTLCLEVVDLGVYAIVEIKPNWRYFYNMRENAFYLFFYLFLFVLVYICVNAFL